MLAALCTLAALFAVTTAATAACTDNLGCQLNGECVAGACRCDQGWQGTDCGPGLVPARDLWFSPFPLHSEISLGIPCISLGFSV